MTIENNTQEWRQAAERKNLARRMEKARRRKRKVWRMRALLLLGGILIFAGVLRVSQNPIKRYAKANGISMDEYPEDLLKLYERNKETETFVEEYPLKKDAEPEIDLSDLADTSEIPSLLQWDQRWGYHQYAGEVMGLSGCGPTALAICVSTLTGNSVDPPAVCDWSVRNGHRCEGNGSYHTLIPEGAKHYGLNVEKLGRSSARELESHLSSGHLVIAIMAKGHFTSSGHFIVLRGITENGKVLVADPASYRRSEQAWDMSIILNEARGTAAAGGPFWCLSK